MYGGFGFGDTSFADRDPVTKPAVLDGNDAAYHVVVGAANSLLDGFIVRGGYANGEEPHNVGGGMLNDGVSTAVVNCTFSNNRSEWHGGGIFNRNCAAGIVNCTFNNNTAANNGGAIYNEGDDDDGSGGSGGSGIHPIISECTFRDNRNSRFGGAVFNHYCPAEITNCIFGGNYANHNGGGVYCDNSDATIRGCIFRTNQSINGGTILPIVVFSDIDQEGFGVEWTVTADSDGNIRMDPLFAAGPLGAFYLSNAAAGEPFTSPCIDAGSGTALALGLHDRTTRTDGEPDAGTVDTGYHCRIP